MNDVDPWAVMLEFQQTIDKEMCDIEERKENAITLAEYHALTEREELLMKLEDKLRQLLSFQRDKHEH